MHLHDLYYSCSIEEEDKILKDHLTKDLAFYNFALDEWIVDPSKCLGEGGDFHYSDIGLVHLKTNETLGGWSDYIATQDGKELYIFWDDIDSAYEEVVKKYAIRKKTVFGVPFHIQKQFSSQLKEQIIDGKHCGSSRFLKSPFLVDVVTELLTKKTYYYEYAISFLHRTDHGKTSLKKLEAYAMPLEEKLDRVEISNKRMGLLFFQNKNRHTFVKYDKGFGGFLIINDKKEILEYWELELEDLLNYVQENQYEILDEEYFNLYFGLVKKEE